MLRTDCDGWALPRSEVEARCIRRSPELLMKRAARKPTAKAAPKKKSSRPVRPDMPAPDGALEVWTDGACSGNPGPGGWAWALDETTYASGSEDPSTNQRMEITAVLEALRVLAPAGAVIVVSDSTYVVNCFRDRWYVKWEANGWRNAKRQPVANDDLWRPLVELVRGNDVTFRWVKGHSGDRLNDLVDALAVAAIPPR